MIEGLLVVVVLAVVLFALVRDRDDAPPPAHVESGATHLRSERPSRRPGR